MANEQVTLPSIKDLEKGGLSLKVNQSDILDLIVASKVQELQIEIEAFFEAIRITINKYTNKRESVFKDQKEKFEKIIKESELPKNFKVRIKDARFRGIYSSINLTTLSNISTASQFRFEEQTYKIQSEDHVKIDYSVEIPLKGKGLTTLIADGQYISDLINIVDEDFLQEISLINSKVQEFLVKFQNFNYANIKRSVRAEFTKKVLENSPEEFKKSLLENFNIAI